MDQGDASGILSFVTIQGDGVSLVTLSHWRIAAQARKQASLQLARLLH